MSRQQRQRDELRELCHSGAVRRATDLAFEHFADFGRDDEILRLLADAIEHTAAPAGVRRRFAELHASLGGTEVRGTRLLPDNRRPDPIDD